MKSITIHAYIPLKWRINVRVRPKPEIVMSLHTTLPKQNHVSVGSHRLMNKKTICLPR